MKKDCRLLTRHPVPSPTESLVGYLLRLAEVNGYPNTYYMLADSGGYRSGDPIDIELLAPITNHSAKLLRPLALRSKEKSTGIVLGQTISQHEVSSTLAHICPRCVEEKGFMEAHFSLALMTICPEHKILIKVCPDCSKPLTWNRPGLLECNCGSILCHAKVQKTPTAVIELLTIVRAKVLSLACPSESVSGLPVQALGAMSLKSLLFLIRGLGRRSSRETGKVQSEMEQSQIIELASQVLSDWPNNFKKMLDAKVGPASPSNPCKLTEGPLKGLYFAIMFGFKQREEVAFVRDELVKYAADRFGLGTDDRSERDRILGCDPRYVTRQEIAERLGVDRRFANRILSEGSVETIRTEGGRKRDRLLIDMATLKIPVGRTVRIYNTQEAADVIGIPRKLLVILKDTGRFETRYLPPGIRGFHEQDVDEYKSRLLNSVPPSSRFTARGKVLNLGDFLVGRYADPMTKAMVIAAIHGGSMSVVNSPAEKVHDIQINQDSLATLIQTVAAPDWRVLRGSSFNLSNQDGGISTCQAAKEIGCDNEVIRILVQKTILSLTQGKGHTIWISAESVDRFRAQYQSLRSLARETQILPRILKRVCEELRIPLLVIDVGKWAGAAFIQKEEIQKLILGGQHARCIWHSTRVRWKRLVESTSDAGAKDVSSMTKEYQNAEFPQLHRVA